MDSQVRNQVVNLLVENKIAKLGLALVGAALIAVGFQSTTIGPVPGGVLVAAGVLTEVFLVFIVSTSIEEARQDIMKHRDEIDEMLREMRDLSKELENTESDLWNLKNDVENTQREIKDSQNEIETARDEAETAKKEIEDLKRDIIRAGRRF